MIMPRVICALAVVLAAQHDLAMGEQARQLEAADVIGGGLGQDLRDHEARMSRAPKPAHGNRGLEAELLGGIGLGQDLRDFEERMSPSPKPAHHLRALSGPNYNPQIWDIIRKYLGYTPVPLPTTEEEQAARGPKFEHLE